MTRLAASALLGALAAGPFWSAVAAQAPGVTGPSEPGRGVVVPAMPGGGAGDTIRPGGPLAPEFWRRLESVRRRRMAEYLRLDEAQAANLERSFGEFRRRQIDLSRERARLLADLRRGVEAEDAGRQPLARGLEALRWNERERERAHQRLRESLREGLTVEQQARLHLFAERFQRQVAEGVSRIRERRARPRPGIRGASDRPAWPGPGEPGEPGEVPSPSPAR